MRTIPEDEKVFLGGAFDGHIGRDAGNYNSVHGGFGLGARNESGGNLLEDAHPTQAFSTGFQDEEENRREEGRVLGKDHVGETQRGYGHNPVKQDKFIGLPSQSEDANEMWVNMAKTIRIMAKETLGVLLGKPKVLKESWWWNDEVKKKIKDKNKRFKDLIACMEDEDRIEKRVSYKEAKRVAKKAVTEAKNRGYEDLYQKLDTKEGEKQIFKLARTRFSTNIQTPGGDNRAFSV
ncbi:uncharacterized protein LOC130821601 [Amaranthus tricolor]|uniref:uncharacterized protein LOC130821601 n=1 Tax=Amaranthus tricolor TaxID=29722 RepID=UPI00258BFB2D|nr:uncharacterized protein LOC130821601 [Amaranthus tricolor]